MSAPIFSIRTITELIRRELSGGFPSDMDRVKDAEIRMHIVSLGNAAMKAEVFNTTYNFDGDSIPDGYVYASYDITIPSNAPISKTPVTLPVIPMSLPNRMGVFEVTPTPLIDGVTEFIPLPSGVVNQILKDKVMNPLASICYSWDNGNKITVFCDLHALGVTSVTVKMCVMDLNNSAYTEDTPLPLTPEMVSDIVVKIVNIYKQESNTQRTEDIQPQPVKQ